MIAIVVQHNNIHTKITIDTMDTVIQFNLGQLSSTCLDKLQYIFTWHIPLK